MARRHKQKSAAGDDLAARNFDEGYEALCVHPLFAPLLAHAPVYREKKNGGPPDGWAVVTSAGSINIHPTRLGTPQEWMYVLAHCVLHLGFGHFRKTTHPREWNAACDCYVAQFLSELRLGQPPGGAHTSIDLPARTEERLYNIFCENGIPPHLQEYGTGTPGGCDMIPAPQVAMYRGRPVDWAVCLGAGLANAVSSAIQVAAGVTDRLESATGKMSAARRARNWFMSSYPLLGALAAGFEIIEDPLVCQRWQISVAAVDAETREIFMNPAAGMDEQECRFVMAHELLHVGLRHHARRQGRDAFLWNVACDFVINGWLVEMGIGALPNFGVLYDPALKGESAEAIYDRMAADLRRCRKLCTLAGVGKPDILERDQADWWNLGPGMDLDEFYRRCLCQGLAYYEGEGRGLLPKGLVEEIRALMQPPVPWDVELARWFDHYFPPVDKTRSYARPSRRQSSTPDIPRPRYVTDWRALDGRTYGVVLDSSGSMDCNLLAKALGAIAGYSLSRDVPAVRVVFCDAAAYDVGYLPPEEIAGRVRVRGRGGTVLQPGIDLLERAKDFPPDGPLLIITDGLCDRLQARRPHAFILPQGRSLPFVPRGEVFRIS